MENSGERDGSPLAHCNVFSADGPIFRELAKRKETKVEEGHVMPGHVHMLLTIPPKYSVSQVVGFMKGKSAIHIAQHVEGRKRNFFGQSFWARGYFVSTVGALRGYAA